MRFLFVLGLSTSWSVAVADAYVFEHVTAITMSTPPVIEETTIVVVGDRITAIGETSAIPSAAVRIDGSGRFLLPGLADMHVHVPSEEHFWLYLANGVTTVRNMWGSRTHRRWQESINKGEMIGPAIYSVGPLMDGPTGFWRTAILIGDAEMAGAAVLDVAKAGFPAIKVYNDLSVPVYRALVAAAYDLGLRVEGHVPRSVGLDGVIEAGQWANEHLSGFEQATVSARFREVLGTDDTRARLRTLARLARSINDGSLTLDDVHDPDRIEDLAQRVAAAGMWNVPTLVLHTGHDDRRTRNAMRYLDPRIRDRWRDDPAVAADRRAIEAVWHRYRLSLVRALDDAGAPWLVGTDAPNAFVVPGFSIHQELEHLVDAGISRARVLRAATRDAAAFTRENVGQIEVGRRADLVLLETNPLDDLKTLQHPVGVMVRGRWLPRAVLDTRLAELATRYAPSRSRLPPR